MPESEAQNVGEAVDQISSLIRGEPAETPAESPAAETPPPDTPVEPEAPQELTLASLAETLGRKPAELYAELKIPVDGGDAITLGEFKDAGVELRGVKAARNELAENKVAFENDVMMQKQTLEKAIAKIPPELLTGAMIAEVQAEHQQTIQRERAALLTIRPELSNPANWNATRDLLVEHLKPYGFHEIEVDSIVDHRLAKYVIDNAEREKRIRALNADSLQVSEPSKLARPSAKPRQASRAKTDAAGDKTRVRSDKRSDQVAEVAKLIEAANK